MFSLHWFYCLSCTEGTLVIKKRKQSNSLNMFCIEGSLLLFFTLLFILNVAMFLRKLKQKQKKKTRLDHYLHHICKLGTYKVA